MKKFLLMLLCLLCCLSMVGAQADINLPASLTVIGEEAFAGDSSISGLIEVSGNVYRIQAGAFSNTKLTGLELSSSVTYVEDNIIAGSPVVYVAVVNSDAVLADNALTGASVILSWDGDAACQWAQSHEVEWYRLDSIALYNGFYYEVRNDGTAKLLFAKDTEAVSGNVKVPMIVGGASVTEVSEHAFTRCYGLESVSIPDSVSAIPEGNNWRVEDISTYSTSAEPVLPSEEYIDLEMPEPSISLPVGMNDYSVSWPENTPEGTVMFYSSDDSIVSVNQWGGFTCNALGNAAITMVVRAEDAIYSGVVQVHVVEPEVDLTVNPGYENLVVGQTTPVSLPTLNTNLSVSGFLRSSATFASSNTDVFTCTEGSGNATCFVTGVGEGTANLIVTISFGEFSQTEEFPITVRNSELGLNFTRLYTYSGLNEQLVLLGDLPEDASIEWSSDDENLITVNHEGLLTAHEVIDGQYEEDFTASTTVHCTVTYADGNVETYSCDVRVYDRDPYIGIEEDPLYFYVGEIGNTSDLPVYMDWWWVNFHTALQPEPVLIFESDDSDILYFAEDGTYHANREGTVTVTVYGYADIDNGLEAVGEFTAEVYRPALDLWLCENWDEEGEFWFIDLNMTDTQRHLQHDMNHDLPLSSIEFSSSNPNVVKISSDGYMEPISAGDAEVTMTITAINGDSISASASVHVIGDAFDMDVDTVELNVGETASVYSMPEIPEDLFIVESNFYSENDAIAVFDNSVIYGISAGTTYVCHDVRLNDDSWLSAKTLVNVVDPECPVKLNANLINLEYSQTYQLAASFSKEPESVVWASDDENMAIVDENGLVTLVDTYDHGHFATISCTAVIDGEEYTAYCTVQCPPLRVWFRHFPNQMDLSAGESCEIEYQLATSDPELKYSCVWSTEDEDVATIDKDGVLYAHSTGISGYTLTIVDENNNPIQRMNGVVYVNVAPDVPTGISLNRKGYLITFAEDSRYLGEDYTHVDAHIESEHGWDHELLRYSSDNENIVTIDENGYLTGVAPGMANITVTMAGFPNISATAPVIVAEDVWLSINEDSLPICLGEEFVFDLHGMPFDEGNGEKYQFQAIYNSNITRFVGTAENGDMTFKVIRDEHYSMEGQLYVFGEHYDNFDIWFQTCKPEYSLNETVLYLCTGEEYDIWPEFDRNMEFDGWASTDENVARYDEEQGRVVAVGPGSCTIGFAGVDWEGNKITAQCEVIVSEDTFWRIVRIETPNTLTAGYSYDANCRTFSRNSYIGPEITWEISDTSVLSYNEGYNRFEAHKAGVVDVTATATKFDEVKTITKTIRVVELPLRMAQQNVELRPGQSKQLSVIAAQDKEIATIDWKSANPSVISVDEVGKITALSNDGVASVYAIATFADGSTATAHVAADIVSDNETWANFYHLPEGTTLSLSEIIYPDSQVINAEFSTNVNPEELTVEWNVDNGDILKVDPQGVFSYDGEDDLDDNQFFASAQFNAVGEGCANVQCVIYNNDLGIWQEKNIHVCVASFDIIPNQTEYTAKSGTSFCPDMTFAQTDGYGPIYIEYTTTDSSIARANVWNDIQVGAPGTATITYSAYYNEKLLDSEEFHVTVEGAFLDCADYELNVGETTQMIPTVFTQESYHTAYWTSSDSNVATVNNDGIVYAVGGGAAAITYHVQYGDGQEATVTHIVHVSESGEAAFHLVDSFIDSPCEREIKLEYVNNTGSEPESIEWSVNGWGEIDNEGRLYLNGCGEDRFATVTCTATFSNKTYTDTCLIRVIPEEVYIGGFDGVSIIDEVGNEDYWGVSYEVSGKLTDVTVDFYVDDPSIAEMFIDENETLVIRGLNSGTTTAHYIVYAPSGHMYEKCVDVYVATEVPELTKFEVQVDTLLLFAPECGPFSERYIPWHSEPAHIPYAIEFTSDNTDVVEVNEEGYVWAVAPGTANITITLPDYPEFSTKLPVVVAHDGGIEVTGLENGIQVNDQVQLGIESTDNWHTYANDITFSCGHHEDQVLMTEDGLIRVFEPDDREDAWHFWVDFNFCGDEYQINTQHFFSSYRDENYFYAFHPDSEHVVHPGQEFWPDVRASFDIHGWKVTSEDESIIAVAENGDHWIGVKPGKAKVTYQAYMNEEHTELSEVLTSEFTVKEPETPIVSISTAQLIRVGDTEPVYEHTENWYYNGPDWYLTSSDENVLRCNGYDDGCGTQTVSAVGPGTAEITMHANYGDSVGTATVQITVLEAAPAWVNCTDVELRPGASKQLFIDHVEGKTINSIQWHSSNYDAVYVDQNGVLTAGNEGHAQIMAYITLTDGTFFTTTTKVGIAQNDGLWIDGNFDLPEITLGTNEAFGPATSTEAEVYFHSNMAEGEPQITWTSSDDSVVTIGESYCTYDPNNDGAVSNRFRAVVNLTAVGEGSAEISITVESGYGQSETRSFWVNVVTPSCEINSDEPEVISMRVNEKRDLNFWFGGDWQSQFSYYTLNSSNEGIVSVNCHHQLTGVAPGTATITVAAYSDNSRLMATRDFAVTVEGPVIALNQTELTLVQGESETLTASIPEDLEIHDAGWYSDDNGVAVVASNGTVVATGIGQTKVYYSYHINGEYFAVPCHVNVPHADNGFALNESSITLASGTTMQLNYVCEETPDSVEWSVSNEGNLTVDQEGNVTAHSERYYDDDMVYCTATFGDEVRIAGCYVKPAISGVFMSGIGEMHGLSVDEDYYLGVEYRVIGDITAHLEWHIEDTSIADIFMTDDAHVWIHGKQPGVTKITIAVVGSDGSRYEQSSTIYVNTPFPTIESINAEENPMVINVGSDRWIPWHTEPSGVPISVVYSCGDENDIIGIRQDGWIEGHNPGRVTVHMEDCEDLGLWTDFDVIVLGNPTFSGLENDTMELGTTAKLEYSFGDVDISDLNFTLRCDHHYGQIGLYDDNTIEARESGQYTVWLDLNDYDLHYEYQFTVVEPEEYFCAKYQELAMYEDQVCGLEYWTNYVDFITCEFSEDGVVEYDGYHNNLIALAPGETTVTITGHIWNGEGEEDTLVPCSNQMHIVVYEAEPLDFEISSPCVLCVGEEHEVWIYCEDKKSTHDLPYTNVSSNEDVLSIIDGYRMVARKAGQVTLTVTLGEGENATVREFTISVVE